MSDITLRQLEIFALACKLESFTKTAKMMDISKPAVSKQIQNFEAECNAQLFEQVGRRIYMTSAAKVILPKVVKIINEISGLKDTLKTEITRDKNIIRLSLGHLYANLVFTLLHHFSEKYDVEFDIALDKEINQKKKLDDNKYDFVITSTQIRDAKFDVKHFSDIDFVLTASTNNQLTKTLNVRSSMFSMETFIQLKGDHATNEELQKKMARANVDFNRIYDIETYPAIKEAIKSGLGIGILPYNLVQDELKANTLAILPFDKLNFKRALYLISRKKMTRSATADAFVKFMCSEAKGYL